MAVELETEEEQKEEVPRRQQAIELIVFLFLIVPSLVLSFFVVQQGNLPFPLVATSTILRDLSLVALILYFLWRCGEPLAHIGWTFKNGWSDVALGLILFLPVSFAAGALESLLLALGLPAPSTPRPSFLTAVGYPEYVLAFVLVVVVAIAEEAIFRGYLIHRLGNVTRSLPLAVILSVAIFALGHGYEASVGVITVAFLGAAFALVYIWRRSIVAPAVMHFLVDFISVVLVPLLSGR